MLATRPPCRLEARRAEWVWDANGDYVGGDFTGEQGTYRVTGLEPGTYYLGTTGWAHPYLNEL